MKKRSTSDVLYVYQAAYSRLLKFGITDDVRRRGKEHSCVAGPCYLIGSVYCRDGARPLEDRVKAELAGYILTSDQRGSDRNEPYEIVPPSDHARRYFECLDGWKRQRDWLDGETAKEWLRRASHPAAKFALSEEARLRKIVPKSARGGWVLWESISGTPSRQLDIDFPGLRFGGLRLDQLHGWLFHVLTYKRIEFRFPIFVEACERMAVRPPADAIRTGVRPHSPRIPISEETRRLRNERRASRNKRPPIRDTTTALLWKD